MLYHESMSFGRHAIRVVLLMAGAAALLAWDLRHTEATSPDGVRYVRQAEQIGRGQWRQGLLGAIDHPLHPLGIVAVHGVVGGSGPVSWQRAALALACGCFVLLVIPAYLLAREAFGDGTAWLGGLLVIAQPLLGRVVVANALSESSFLVFWTWGVWAAIRFLREGRFGWLASTVAFGVLAYLSRPEGLLLPLTLAATLVLLPLHRAARICWPRWRAALSMVVLGSLVLAGPYMILKGRMGTKPAIARVLGLAPAAPADAAERERPLPPDQTARETYRLAVIRVAESVREVVPFPLMLLAALGLATMPASPARARTRALFSVIVLAALVGLVRLHATVGYVSPRHALIPGIVLILAAAHGLVTLAARVAIPGDWLAMGRERLQLGPAVWALLLVSLVLVPRLSWGDRTVPGPFNVYRHTAAWIARHTAEGEQILDMTDWSLYLSGRAGHGLGCIEDAPADPDLRWIIVPAPRAAVQAESPRVIRDLIGDRSPVATIPASAEPGQIEVLVYDRWAPTTTSSDSPAVVVAPGSGTLRR